MANPIPSNYKSYDILIGGTKVAPPSEWVPAYQDLVTNSTRVGGGRMRANYIDVKRAWAAKWINLSEQEYQLILSKIERRFEFNITCYDPELGWIEKTFYKGDRQWEQIKHFYNGRFGTITVTFIEV